MSSSTEPAPLASVTPLPVPELRPRERPHRWHPALGGPGPALAGPGAADRARDDARAQGYAVGWAQGLREARDLVRAEAEEARQAERAEHDAALRGLAAAVETSQQRLAAACAAVEVGAARLAMDVVEVLLDRELRALVDPGEQAVARALALAPEQTAVVRLAPDAVTAEASAELAARGLRLVADPALGAADVVVDLGDSVVDARLSTALDRLREVLS
jgi:flagellar assembly protein FliH